LHRVSIPSHLMTSKENIHWLHEFIKWHQRHEERFKTLKC
jgi:hypothetical protein